MYSGNSTRKQAKQNFRFNYGYLFIGLKLCSLYRSLILGYCFKRFSIIAISSVDKSISAAFAFSSKYLIRFVPGIGMIFPLCARTETFFHCLPDICRRTVYITFIPTKYKITFSVPSHLAHPLLFMRKAQTFTSTGFITVNRFRNRVKEETKNAIAPKNSLSFNSYSRIFNFTLLFSCTFAPIIY